MEIVETVGKLNVRVAMETLAKIIGEREHVEITVESIRRKGDVEKEPESP